MLLYEMVALCRLSLPIALHQFIIGDCVLRVNHLRNNFLYIKGKFFNCIYPHFFPLIDVATYR